ncbi:hypothetical protein [Enterococcus sp.]|uniref:hypothetical protein n=1 Tax=Enterococcus sp. TaxID=35783 RepID=UPI000ED61991|nr:hypothetical protein [Enterococcus sp.]HCM86217.1 hypothetical protein [Enterococcus sp.]
MNFEVMQQLMDEQLTEIAPLKKELDSLKQAKAGAEEELQSIYSYSREAFIIKGEIAQLEEVITRKSNEYHQIIIDRASSLKKQLSDTSNRLIRENELAIKDKYSEDVKVAVDRLIELMKDCRSEESNYIKQVKQDMAEFSIYDDKKFPDVSYISANLVSFGYEGVFSGQIERLYK